MELNVTSNINYQPTLKKDLRVCYVVVLYVHVWQLLALLCDIFDWITVSLVLCQ